MLELWALHLLLSHSRAPFRYVACVCKDKHQERSVTGRNQRAIGFRDTKGPTVERGPSCSLV